MRDVILGRGLAVIALGLGLSTACSWAADLPARPAPQPVAPLPNPSAWTFTATFYGWATALTGNVGVGRLPTAKVDSSFADIAQNLKGAFMGALTARNETFLFGGDLFWSKLGDNVSFKIGDGPLADRRNGAVARFTQTLTIASAFAGYRIPIGTPDLALYGTVGVRYQNLQAKMNVYRNDPRFDRYRSEGVDWADPVVGLAANYRINDKWYIDALADVGGFGVGSQLTSQGLVTVGYRWTPSVSTAIGYRALYTNYTQNNDRGGSFRYETTMHGPIATLSFNF